LVNQIKDMDAGKIRSQLCLAFPSLRLVFILYSLNEKVLENFAVINLTSLKLVYLIFHSKDGLGVHCFALACDRNLASILHVTSKALYCLITNNRLISVL